MDKMVNTFVTKINSGDIDQEKIAQLSQSLGLGEKFVEILLLRGLDNAAQIQNFLYPSAKNFHDPLLMKDMRTILSRIDEAIQGRQRIVIYSDYDADGICSAAILSLYLASFELDIFVHIPNREDDGYGLSVESLEKIIEKCEPDLIITCDCGISSCKEVEHVLDLGIDIIVTDHHEPAPEIPACPVLNPKQTGCDYPIDNLCGAGVVLKLIQAHGGLQKAEQFYSLAAIATIADLVPLKDENRLIVQLGLKRLNMQKNLGIKLLLESIGIEGVITSGEIAFKIAPRINAAGRMGDAYRAFLLLTSDDSALVSRLVKEINEDNQRRKELCDKMYGEAIKNIKEENLITNRAIILHHSSWEKGITGIVAAKLSGDFNRPAFIMVKSGDGYKGTVRSIEDINIYELLTSVKDLLLEFGGHSQAAGFSIDGRNIEAFKERVNAYLAQYPASSFLPRVKYDVELNIDEADEKFVKDLELLEPFGNSNSKPLFRIQANNVKISSCNNPEHTYAVLNERINAYAFNFRRTNYLFFGNDVKEIILELKLNGQNRKNAISAFIKAVVPTTIYLNDTVAKANYIKYINYKERPDPKYLTYRWSDLDQMIDGNIYGTLFIAGCSGTYMRFVNAHNMDSVIAHEFMNALLKNNYTRIMISPDFDEYLLISNYSRVIFLDSPISKGIISYINKHTNAQVYIPEEDNLAEFIGDVNLDRSELAKYYEELRKNSTLSADNLFAYSRKLKMRVQDFDMKQFMVCLSIFIDLDLVRIAKNNFSVILTKNGRVDLSQSKVYTYLKERIKQINGSV